MNKNLLTKLKKNKKGFTLIELIVVIAILGILAAIAIPRFAGVQDRAKVKTDYSNAAMIGSAAETALVEGKITSANTAAEIKTALTTTNTYLTTWPAPTFKTTGVFDVAYNATTKGMEVYYRTATGVTEGQVKLYPAPETIGDSY